MTETKSTAHSKPPKWPNMAEKELAAYHTEHLPEQDKDLMFRQGFIGDCYRLVVRAVRGVKVHLAKMFVAVVHFMARVANKPLVDIGRQYSVSELNNRISQLEEILMRRWMHLEDADFLDPQEEIRLYVAACHVVRQYDRVSRELLSRRLGISQEKAGLLINKLEEDQVLTEGYEVTYHDVMRQTADVVIEQELKTLNKQPAKVEPAPEPATKRH